MAPAGPGAEGAEALVERLLAGCHFPPAGSSVDLAVSGGPDSSALVALASAAGLRSAVFHVDHGLRPGSELESDLVRVLADRFGASFEALEARIDPGPNLEARARAARFAALPPGALTGHTADDQAETILLNLMRGAGLDGMGGMRSENHPLLGLRRAETVALCEALDLRPLHDPSNEDRSLRRNRVRHELLPLIDDIAERDVVPILNRQAGLSRDAAVLLAGEAAQFDPTDAAGLSAAPVVLARLAIRRWLRTGPEDHPPDAAAVERVLAVARNEIRATEVGGGRRVARTAGKLRIEPPGSA